MQKKKKYNLFHKVSLCDAVPLQLPTMTFKNIKVKGESSVKFLGVINNKNLKWQNHIEVVENNISKTIRVLYRAIHVLDFKKPSKNLFLLHSHLYQLC